MNLSFTPFAAAAVLLSPVLPAQRALWQPVDPGQVPGDLRAWDATQRRDDPSITGSTFVRLHTDALRDLKLERPGAEQRFRLELPADHATVAIDRVEETYRHDVFFGSVGDDGERFVLALGTDDGSTAADFVVGDVTYTLNSTFRDGLWVLRSNDLTRLDTIEPCGTDDAHVVRAPQADRVGGGGGGSQPPGTADAGGRTIVDVIMFYTNPVRQFYGTTGATQAEMALRVAIASQTCADSNVDIAYRMVRTEELQYRSAGDSSGDLSKFRGRNDRFMSRVHGVRNEHGADLMALITNTGNVCGIAYLMAPSSASFGSSAFSLTQRICLRGNTLTHELGHNQGCAHDRQNASFGAWPYSFGYRTPDHAYRTVMAYAPGTRADFWSNPAVTYRGYSMGTTRDHNARGLNDSKNDIRRFWPTRTLVWCDLGGGIAGPSGEPMLTGSGTVDNSVPIELRIGNTVPGAPGALVIGLRRQDLPFFGGILIPSVDVTFGLTGSANDIPIDLSILASQPSGSAFYFQTFFLDAGAPQGLSGSDGIKVDVP